ncbi:probable carboxylesterase 7 [Jatropha curcas]|uniref:probable carboxylesterase 7 n=1 Tax=Jatropha curcas TaxID=180498 RepID=UPI0009D783DF|nr:probable carboxylesterase 7 [Jatropha curcas]
MDSNLSEQVAYDFSPFFRIYKDGRIERLLGVDVVPPGLDQDTQVQSKDVIYLQEKNLSSRLYLPRNAINSGKKLPLLVYYHGGGFCIETPFSPAYHNHLNNFVAEANIIAVSVDYRRAPEHPLPIAYEDSRAALKWVASHVNGSEPKEWLNSYVDFGKVFLSGDSAGANIAHHMGIRNGKEKLLGVNLVGIVLVHPYFWGKEPISNEAKESEKRATVDGLWRFSCPTTSGCDDPLINPLVDPDLGKLGCSRVLVMVAEKDLLRDRGWQYYYKLKEIGWKGLVEIMESKEEDHAFHMQKSSCENAVGMLKRMASFINENTT